VPEVPLGILIGLKSGTASVLPGAPGALPSLPGLPGLFNLTGILENLASMQLVRGESAAAGIARALRDPRAEFAEANFKFYPTKTPNDPRYQNLWAMPKIGAPTAWDTTTGAATPNTKVCVIDTGIDGSHQDLRDRVLAQNTYLNGNGRLTNTRIYDDVGHGTHVAGTIAAIGNDGVGVAGLNYGGIQVSPSCSIP
jgi:thermitase